MLQPMEPSAGRSSPGSSLLPEPQVSFSETFSKGDCKDLMTVRAGEASRGACVAGAPELLLLIPSLLKGQ